MTFLQLQDAVLERFAEADRTNAKRWLNYFGSVVWSLERWVFKYGEDDVTVTTGSAGVTSLPTDLGRVVGLWNDDGERLRPMRPRSFNDLFYGDRIAGVTGIPEAYTVVNGAVSVGPVSSETKSNYRALYLKRWTDLVADGDIPAGPDEFHWLLVDGARQIGQVHFQDQLGVLADPVIVRGLDSLRRDFLADVDDEPGQWGSDAGRDLGLGWD